MQFITKPKQLNSYSAPIPLPAAHHNYPSTCYNHRYPLHMSQLLDQIPNFDGSLDTLNLFCAAVRRVIMVCGPQCEPDLLISLASKLSGKAADNYLARLTSYISVEQFLSDLAMHYGNIGFADDIIRQLKIITQRSDETAADYGARVQKLLNRLFIIYDFSPDLELSEKHFRKSTANRDALQNFLFGLRSPLEHQVRTEQPQSLDEAIRTAIKFEYMQRARQAMTEAYNPYTGRKTENLLQDQGSLNS